MRRLNGRTRPDASPRRRPVLAGSWTGPSVAFILQGQAQCTGLELRPRDRELVILTTAAVTKPEYEFVQHVPISQAADVDPAIREAIHRQELDSAHDRAVVAFAATVVNSPFVSDDVFAAVHAELSAREIVEALQVIGFYWAFGRVATVLQVEIEPDHGTAVVQASASEKLTGD